MNHLCQVGGQPCVWCNGAVCHNNGTNRCEVYDVQVNGKGKVVCLDLGPRIWTGGTQRRDHHTSPPLIYQKDHCELGLNLKPTMTVLKVQVV